MKAFLILMALFSRIAPARASRMALNMMTTPRVAAVRRDSNPALRDAGEFMPVGTRARCWVRQGGPRRALFVHGWSGDVSQFHALLETVDPSDWTCFVLEMPGHGVVADGPSNVGEFITTVRAALEQMGEPVDLVVGHSMGASALAFVLAERPEIPQAVLISAPTDFRAVVGRMASFLRFGARARQGLLDAMADRVGIGYEVLDIARRGRGIESEVLVIHDTLDREVPFSDALRLHQALPHASLFQTQGLGHRRLLEASQVHAAIEGFVQPAVAVRVSA